MLTGEQYEITRYCDTIVFSIANVAKEGARSFQQLILIPTWKIPLHTYMLCPLYPLMIGWLG